MVTFEFLRRATLSICVAGKSLRVKLLYASVWTGDTRQTVMVFPDTRTQPDLPHLEALTVLQGLGPDQLAATFRVLPGHTQMKHMNGE